MEAISPLELLIYTIASFSSAILSGIAGAGGGFIMTPLLIFMGLSPAQAVATGKLSGLSVTLGSLHGMRGVKRASRQRMLLIVVIAFIVGLLAPIAIVQLDNETYRRVIGVLLLAMIPILVLKKVGHVERHPSLAKKIAGYGLLIISLAIQGVFSSGLGALVSIVLMAFLGMPALEANVTKRYSQVILNVVIILGLLFSGLIVWPIALVGVFAAGAGGYIGGKMAVKRGNTFVMAIFVVLMFLSALELLFG